MKSTYDLFANAVQPASRAALAAVEVLASQGGVEARGAVFTRREVVDFILDLAGYTPDKPLHKLRLLAAWRIHGDGGSTFEALKDAVRAVELHRMASLKTFVSSLAGHVAAQASRLG